MILSTVSAPGVVEAIPDTNVQTSLRDLFTLCADLNSGITTLYTSFNTILGMPSRPCRNRPRSHCSRSASVGSPSDGDSGSRGRSRHNDSERS